MFLSDDTKVAGREWKEIKSETMEDNYKELDWVQALSEHDTKVLEALRKAQKDQGDNTNLNIQPYSA